MSVKVVNFSELKKKLVASHFEPIDILVEGPNRAYVVTVTREKCSSCEEQEPLFGKLSA